MSQEEHDEPFLDDGPQESCDDGRPGGLEDEMLPTVALIQVPHAEIPNLYQWCYEYVEPWQWSSEAERVETGRWVFALPKKPS